MAFRWRVVPGRAGAAPYPEPMSWTTAAAALTLVLLAGGCGGAGSTAASPRQQAPTDGAPTTSSSATPAEGATSSPARVRAERRVVPTRPPAAAPSVRMRPLGHDGPWLVAADLGRGWSARRAAPEDGRLVSRCQRAPLVDIGATESRIRAFRHGAASARQGLAGFADRKSAWRAHRVLESWQADCAASLDRRDAALGAVRHGTRISVVELEGTPHAPRRLTRLLAKVGRGLRHA